MSTISGSTVDTNDKCQRLSAELVKLRDQISALKTNVLEEQSKNEDQQRELNLKEQKLRKAINENESLLFRNEQLVKRVEALQTTLDDTNATFLLAKNKKKHKSANLRLFGETSRQQALNPTDPMLVLEQELERKLSENCELHSKIFDLEKQSETVVNEFTQRIKFLEDENIQLKKIVNSPHVYLSDSKLNSLRTQDDFSTVSEEEKEQVPCTVRNVEDVNKLNEVADEQILTSSSSSCKSVERSNCNNENENGINDSFYLEKIKHLTMSLRYAMGRAEYFKNECESLVRRNLFELKEKSELTKKLNESIEKCNQLNDSLETTRRNYESQMRGLYEHMAEQDAKIIEQSERLLKGVNRNNNGNSVNEKKENTSTLSQNLRKIVGK